MAEPFDALFIDVIHYRHSSNHPSYRFVADSVSPGFVRCFPQASHFAGGDFPDMAFGESP